MKHTPFVGMVLGIALVIGSFPVIGHTSEGATWRLPKDAIRLDEHTYYLGSKIDPISGRQVEGYAFIKRKGAARGGSGGSGGAKNACYSYLANGAKWKVAAEPWEMNPNNGSGLDPTTIFLHQASDIATWEDAADGTVDGLVSVDILGDGTMTDLDYAASAGTLNGKNEVSFADASGSGVIAVTTVWGIFGGPAAQRELVEWDQVYDDVDFDWSLSGASTAMDFDNIAVHELGHAVGMGHPKSTCSLETMYAYATEGETLKRDLHNGDIVGINLLY